MFCPFLLALKKEAERRIEGEVDVWTAAELGDDWLVELHVLAFVQEPDCWCNDLCDFACNTGKMAYFCCKFDGHDDENVYVTLILIWYSSYPAIILLQT